MKIEIKEIDRVLAISGATREFAHVSALSANIPVSDELCACRDAWCSFFRQGSKTLGRIVDTVDVGGGTGDCDEE